MADAEKDAVAETHSQQSNGGNGMVQVPPPFEGLPAENALGDQLELIDNPIAPQPNGAAGGHDRKRLKAANANGKQYLPGQPRQLLDGTPGKSITGLDVAAYLELNHLTDELNGILPWMKYIFVSVVTQWHMSLRRLTTG
jgi:hypothetical protein